MWLPAPTWCAWGCGAPRTQAQHGAQRERRNSMKLRAVFLCFAGALSAQQNTVIHTETREVLVDAIVTAKNGSYVPDLTAKDFHITQDGKDQTIQGFELESASAAQTRSLVLFFDETSMEARDQILVRQAAASFIDAEAGPNHRMAIVG